ncbi:nuclear transport factor 2 family protein [Mycobacterium sp. NPDC048908]|uniref:nuclear transport factor 2 family protein n=1 Tax=Mycobacterium sp. NPDC048908 TaxID=3364292 RepID=UPI003716D3AD
MQDTEILGGVLDQWQAGIDAHDPQQVAAVFAQNAIFQGLRPYSVGRAGVFDYYDSQPRDMRVSYRVLETRRPADDLVLGYIRADFSYADRPTVCVNLGVLVARTDDGWHILHYQASIAG